MDWSICGVSFSSCFWVSSSFTMISLSVRQIAPTELVKARLFQRKQQTKYSIPRQKAQEIRRAGRLCRPALRVMQGDVYLVRLSTKRMRMVATWARVALPWGASSPPSVPEIRPSPTAQRRASAA